MTEQQIQDLFSTLRDARNAKIDEIAGPDASEMVRFQAKLEADFEHSPMTTNWKMLEMIGINPATADLDTILQGLARWNIYFADNCPQYTDEEILAYLKDKILLDEVRLLPPCADFSEFIAMSTKFLSGKDMPALYAEDGTRINGNGKPIIGAPRRVFPHPVREPAAIDN